MEVEIRASVAEFEEILWYFGDCVTQRVMNLICLFLLLLLFLAVFAQSIIFNFFFLNNLYTITTFFIFIYRFYS